jgi:hypothetical protein
MRRSRWPELHAGTTRNWQTTRRTTAGAMLADESWWVLLTGELHLA